MENQLDLGFLVARDADESLRIETILSESLVVALSENHPLSEQAMVQLTQLREELFIMGFWDSRCGLYTTVMDVCRQAGFEPNAIQVTNEMQLTLGFVAACMGIALLPNSIRHFHRNGVVYRPLQAPTRELSLAIAWQPDNQRLTLPNFLQVIRAIIPLLSYWDRLGKLIDYI